MNIQYNINFSKISNKDFTINDFMVTGHHFSDLSTISFNDLEKFINDFKTHRLLKNYVVSDNIRSLLEKHNIEIRTTRNEIIVSSNKIFDLPTQKKRRPTNYFRCVWLGRLDGQFKNPILKRVMLDLSNHAKNSDDHITFTIIGTGPGLSEAKNVASKIKNMEVIF